MQLSKNFMVSGRAVYRFFAFVEKIKRIVDSSNLFHVPR